MNSLEKLGLEVCAYTLLGSRTQAASLMALLNANGRIVGWETVAQAKAWKMETVTDVPQNAAKVRVCLLRESMADVGIGGLIQTHEGIGYSLPEPGRTSVIERLMEELS
ncbi:OmpR/PhoB-type DNA-binding domain containing protein [uncultured Caudovirales phage]|uniref:OmpR/PhoB-type DNA-binding domain containing protein n=1 Tax=uncultured Caudovirales phage TaxID=2100421 RepID=A0A6J5NCT6_9CAUD|nr:OmpR/PhoB-type DNA-binding domain containing protein [uncultured Caudovirales phage]